MSYRSIHSSFLPTRKALSSPLAAGFSSSIPAHLSSQILENMKFLKKRDLMTPEKRLNEVLWISKSVGNTGEKPQHALPRFQFAFWELSL